ncbi:MAG: S-adenosyl-l-methionine hydroxide adenosyltransferase family protein [Syntrophobacteraceae bacterium]
MSLKIVTLLTDFGIQDHYVASMKGVILGILPEARLIDISHMVPPQDIRSGAYLLAASYRDFPEGTVHVAVVDPGVGTTRRALLIRTELYLFVGPDNGIFSFVLREERNWRAWAIENPQYMRKNVSKTFHGRDIFAPAAAYAANGMPPETFGPRCSPLEPNWGSPIRTADGLHGEVIHIDHFGNIITNLKKEDIDSLNAGKPRFIKICEHTIATFASTYGDYSPGTLMALIGSSNRLEISINRANAAMMLGIRTGEAVSVHLI